ncbi:hypothetical protein [Sediminitomix flava]|nr:hypothetical protein [Sediminitomix flava]
MKQLIIPVLLLLCSTGISKPLPKAVKSLAGFQIVLGGGRFDEGNAIVEAHDGGYIVAGRSVGVSGNTDLSLWKISSTGTQEWKYTFGGRETEEVAEMIQSNDGGYVIVGSSDSYGSGRDIKDIWAIKVDKNGKQVWTHTYGSATSIDEGKAIIPAHDGGYVIMGTTYNLGGESNPSDVYVTKIDESGVKQWEKKYGGDSNEDGAAMVKTETGYAMVVNTESMGQGKWDIWMFHTDKEGNKQWEMTYGGGDNEMANDVIQTEDSGFILVGYTYSFAEGSHDAWVVKTNNTGQQEWAKNFGGLSTDEFFTVTKTKDGNFAAVGYTEDWKSDEYGDNLSVEGHNVYLVKFDKSGSKIWERSIGGIDEQRGVDMIEVQDGSFVVVGFTRPSGRDKVMILVSQLDIQGQ